jgi:hypothetical protein
MPRPGPANPGSSSEPDADWVLVAEGTRDDGDNDALRRSLLAQHPELESDAAIELRFDLICARNGMATLRIPP